MSVSEGLLVAKADKDLCLWPKMANRHGLIAGATGTGKTVTIKVLAEAFSSIGVPVFLADIKGDLAGLCLKGEQTPNLTERIQRLGLSDFDFQEFPVRFWDVYGELGHPVRTTITEMGPMLISRLLDLNEAQTGILNIVFRIADDNGLLLLDLKDLKSMLIHVAENSSNYTLQYGTVTKQSVGAIQRKLLILEDQGAEQFFAEPALDIFDFMQRDPQGRGYINVLAAEKLVLNPALYAAFLLYLLSELFEELPEVGDLPQPKMVFFFDEAHLLFKDVPKVLLEKLEQVVRLIRSKGVGIYFVTQNPLDIPDVILGQLGNRVQHALRAYSPREQKAVKAAAETFRTNPKLDTAQVITELGVGEALVSFLDGDGVPTIVERAMIVPPRSKFGTITPENRQRVINSSLLAGKYDNPIDRDSAYEYFQRKYVEKQQQEMRLQQQKQREVKHKSSRTKKKAEQSLLEKMASSAMRSMSSQIGRQIGRGILGSLSRK
ncbi:MAG: helicase HerA-like domain-containing protein [Peptococcia bacterium]